MPACSSTAWRVSATSARYMCHTRSLWAYSTSSVSVRKRLPAAFQMISWQRRSTSSSASSPAAVGRRVDHALHLVPIGVGAAHARQPRRVGLHHRPRLEQQRQLRDVDRRHEHPAAGNDRHELIAGETLQRLADRGAADAELALQRLLAHDLAGRELEPDDHAPDLGVGPCAQRCMCDTFMIYQRGRWCWTPTVPNS